MSRMTKKMNPSDLYVLCHVHCYDRIPEEECQAQVERLQALGFIGKREKITEAGLNHVQKGLVL